MNNKKIAQELVKIARKLTNRSTKISATGLNDYTLKEHAKRDVKRFGDDKIWVSRIQMDYDTFKRRELTELSKKEYKIYQKECLRILREEGTIFK